MGLDVATREGAAALDDPGFAHLLAVGMSVDGVRRFIGRAPDVPTDVFSVTKSVLARAALDAVDEGIFASLDDPITLAAATGATVRRLLWMSQSWSSAPDMDALEAGTADPLPAIVAALGAPDGPPGGYRDAAAHLLIRELQHRTGSARAHVEASVLRPAGIEAARWESDQTGTPWGHAHLFLSVRELVALGEHWLGQGWPASGEPERGAAAIPPESLPYAAGLWWAHDPDRVMAAGWGGQCLIMVPSASIVLATLGVTGWDRSSNTDTLPAHWRPGRDLLEKTLLPALIP